jgi:hypothetical protein
MIVRNITKSNTLDNREVLCKAVVAAKTYLGDRFFTKSMLQFLLIKTVRVKKPIMDSTKYVPLEALTKEQAGQMFNIMLDKGYIEYSHVFKKDPKNPSTSINIPEGEKVYKVGMLRYTECTQTSWYKNRQRKEKFLLKEEQIDKRSCRALQQIYTMFGNMPFSYKTVTYTANMITNFSKDKNLKLTPAEKSALDHMKTKLYNYDKEGFKQVWQSLVRNGYILPHKIKTPSGYVKSTGLYKINHPYLKYCLAEMV